MNAPPSLQVTWHHMKNMDSQSQTAMYSLLAEYFSTEKHPMTRFDVSHLVTLSEQVSYPGAVILGWEKRDDGSRVPVGMVFVEVMIPRETRPYGHEISRLYVTPDARKRGYGGVLMMNAITYVHERLNTSQAFLVVGDENKKALSMYETLGFETCDGAQQYGSEGVKYLELVLRREELQRESSLIALRLAARLQMRRDKLAGRVSSARLFAQAK